MPWKPLGTSSWHWSNNFICGKTEHPTAEPPIKTPFFIFCFCSCCINPNFRYYPWRCDWQTWGRTEASNVGRGTSREVSRHLFFLILSSAAWSCSWGTQRLRVQKHDYKPTLPGQGIQTSGINCSVSRRKDNLGHCLPRASALASLTLSLPLFSRLKHHLFSLQMQGGQKGGGGSSEGCCKVFFVPGIHISDAGPGKLYYLPLLEWERKIAGTSTALGYMQCKCLYKRVPWESHWSTRHTQQTWPKHTVCWRSVRH